MCMEFGLLAIEVVCQNIQPVLQKILLFFASLVYPLKYTKHFHLLLNIHKSHSNKFKQVSLIISVGVCFVVFINSLFSLEV